MFGTRRKRSGKGLSYSPSIVLCHHPLNMQPHEGSFVPWVSTNIWLQNLFDIARNFWKAVQVEGKNKPRPAVPTLGSLEPHPPKSPMDSQAINPEGRASGWRGPKKLLVLGRVCKATLLGALNKTGTGPMAPTLERGSVWGATEWKTPGSNDLSTVEASTQLDHRSIMAYMIYSLFAYGVLKSVTIFTYSLHRTIFVVCWLFTHGLPVVCK